jgi:uncharacterized protein DUF4214
MMPVGVTKFSFSSLAVLLPIVLLTVMTVACSQPNYAAAPAGVAYCSRGSAIDLVPYFIGQTYQDILQRTPDPVGQVSYITSLINLNTTKCSAANPGVSATSCEWNNNAQTILDFLATPESISKNGTLADDSAFISALYQLLLRANVDTNSLNSYLSMLHSGATRLSVVAQVLSSDQYRTRFACTSGGNSNPSCNGAETIDPVSAFISQSYLDILGRPASSTEQSKWTNSTTSNQAAMCRNISGSAFSNCDRVLEAQIALDLLNSSVTLEDFPPRAPEQYPTLGSNFLRNPLDSDDFFVGSLYQHLVRRAPDAAEFASALSYLQSTNDRVGAIYNVLTSNQYRQRFACYAGASDQLNFGINGHPLTQSEYSNDSGVDYDTQMELVQTAGMRWYRFDYFFSDSAVDFTKMDELLQAAQRHGVQLLPGICSSPSINSETTTALYSKAYSVAFALVSRYKDSIHVWELGNERDNYSLYHLGDPWHGSTYPWESSAGMRTTDYYPPRLATAEAIIHGLADGVRAADPDSLRIVNFAWVHTGFLQNLENDGIPYDIVGSHWYSNVDLANQSGMGDMTCPGQNLPCKQPQQFPNLFQNLQSITFGKPLWVTETNYWPIVPNSVAFDLESEAEYLPGALQLWRDNPATYALQVALVYELLDQPGLPSIFGEQGIYETTEVNNHTYLGAPKPVDEPLKNVITPKPLPLAH